MLVVAITGTGDTTYNNAAALLSDYLPEDVLVYVPSYTTSDGMKVVVQWLKDANINVERVKRHLLPDFYLGNPDATDRALIVLGIEGQEELIVEAFDNFLAVYDLTRGMYRVSKAELPLYGSVSEPESLADDSGTSVGVHNDLALESVTEPGDTTAQFAKITVELAELRKEVNDLRAHVATSTASWEPDPRITSGNIQAGMAHSTGQDEFIGQAAQEELYADTTGKTKYYQNGKGKIRRAGRSKIKAGEKEVWLTEEEVARINDDS